MLNLTSAGDGNYLRFLASANEWQHNKTAISLKHFVLDMGSVRTGWGKMAEGVAPDWQWDEVAGRSGKQPSPEHRRGFSVDVFIKGVGKLEWATISVGSAMGFEKLYVEAFKLLDASPQNVPVVEYTGSAAIKVGKGNTRRPDFTIVKWIPRNSIPWDAEAAPAAPAAPAPTAALDDYVSPFSSAKLPPPVDGSFSDF